MRKMKDSGIEWIGEVSNDVNFVPLKYLLSNKGLSAIKVGPFGSQLSGSDILNEESDYWVYDQRTVLDKNFTKGNTFISEEKYKQMKSFQVEARDILITTRGTIGRICRIPKNHTKGILHPCVIRFRLDDDKYRYDLLELIFNCSNIINRQLLYKNNATTIDVIYSNTLKNLYIPVWSLEKQKSIALFLNSQCTKIDSLVITIQSEIETLEQYKHSLITEAVTKGLDPKAEMKESGIEWIGEVPKEWNHDSLRHLLVSRGTGAWGEELSTDDPGTICLRVADCDFFKARFKDSPPDKLTHRKYSNEQVNKLHLKSGDILIEKSGTPGRTVLFDKDYLALFSNFMECLRFDSRIVSSKYMEYWLMAWYACGCSNYYINQTTYANIDLTLMLTKEHAYFPTLPEQKRITDILDSKCGKIDAIIDRLKSKLADLESYKKSLIFEYVTGKKEVPAA